MPLPAWLTLRRFLELLSLLGMLVAIVPAWVFNQRMRMAHRVAAKATALARSVRRPEAPPPGAAPRAGEAQERIRLWAEELAEEIRAEAEAWKPWHARCLLAAFVLSIIPQAVKVFL